MCETAIDNNYTITGLIRQDSKFGFLSNKKGNEY